jgi:hypothetical protein
MCPLYRVYQTKLNETFRIQKLIWFNRVRFPWMVLCHGIYSILQTLKLSRINATTNILMSSYRNACMLRRTTILVPVDHYFNIIHSESTIKPIKIRLKQNSTIMHIYCTWGCRRVYCVHIIVTTLDNWVVICLKIIDHNKNSIIQFLGGFRTFCKIFQDVLWKSGSTIDYHNTESESNTINRKTLLFLRKPCSLKCLIICCYLCSLCMLCHSITDTPHQSDFYRCAWAM